jgi:alkylation response protein AidB-like acyl-CoA dehydrogenase
MPLVLTEEQELLQETAREFVQERAPVAALRELRDTNDPTGFSRDLWKEMAELGWAGVPFPEELGGAGLGYAELGVILEQAGRNLVASPIVSTVLLGANAVFLGGNEAVKKDVIPSVCEGDRILTLACQEGGRYDPYRVATRAEPIKGGYRLTGEKSFVLDGHVADALVVVARTSGENRDRDGLTVFLVDSGTDGVSITRTLMVDDRNAARVSLDGVEVDGSRVLGDADRGAELLDSVLDRATVGLSAEMLGGIQEAFDRTIQYLKDREQFGVKIGSFQALKHRAAVMFAEIELARSLVMDGLRAVDANRPDLSLVASATKARCSDTFVHVANEGIQMFAGIGMTDEEEIGFFLKRARVAEMTFGDSAFHRNRYATLRGF